MDYDKKDIGGMINLVLLERIDKQRVIKLGKNEFKKILTEVRL